MRAAMQIAGQLNTINLIINFKHITSKEFFSAYAERSLIAPDPATSAEPPEILQSKRLAFRRVLGIFPPTNTLKAYAYEAFKKEPAFSHRQNAASTKQTNETNLHFGLVSARLNSARNIIDKALILNAP